MNHIADFLQLTQPTPSHTKIYTSNTTLIWKYTFLGFLKIVSPSYNYISYLFTILLFFLKIYLCRICFVIPQQQKIYNKLYIFDIQLFIFILFFLCSIYISRSKTKAHICDPIFIIQLIWLYQKSKMHYAWHRF